MTTVHDSLNPAHGVRVLPVPRTRAVLSTSQAKAARTPDTNYRGQPLGVFKPVMKGGPVSVGAMNVARELQRASPIKATPSRIPGSRRRGSAHAGDNRCFSARIPTGFQYAEREAQAKAARTRNAAHVRIIHARNPNIQAQKELAFMRRWHARQLKLLGTVSPFYERCRHITISLFPIIGAELRRIESAQRRSLLAA